MTYKFTWRYASKHITYYNTADRFSRETCAKGYGDSKEELVISVCGGERQCQEEAH